MNTSLNHPTLFFTLVQTPYGKSRAHLLIDSLRAFGGEMSKCPFWLFEANPQKTSFKELQGQGVEILPLEIPEEIRRYDLGGKVYACAQAEKLAPAHVRSLVWIDPGCVIVQPPVLYDLGEMYDATVRPVHIRNVGLLAGDPVDDFWKGVFASIGVEDIQSTVESFVDAQRIRAYFNTHAFAVNPAKGLCQGWLDHFASLVSDQAYQSAACQDEPHQVFLHQAVLSALLVTALEASRIRILPPDYNYPYNLHLEIPTARRASTLNDLVSFVYEDSFLDPERMDITVNEPLRSWLTARVEA